MTHLGSIAKLIAGLIAVGAAFAALALAPSPARAGCTQWDLSHGQWKLDQKNEFTVWITFEQQDTQLTGHASYVHKKYAARDHGDLDGSVQGNAVTFTVHWSPDDPDDHASVREGVYTGTVGDDGSMDGVTSGVRWTTKSGKAVCPVNPVDKQGVFEKPGTGIGDILKETQP